MPTCCELVKPLKDCGFRPPYDILVDRSALPEDFWWYARPWIERAANLSGKRNDPFERFIYLWIVFNGLASQVTEDLEKAALSDAGMVAALGQDPVLSERFESLRAQNHEFHRTTAEFASWWPVFQVRTLHREGLLPWTSGSRRDYVFELLYGDKKEKLGESPCYSPPCFKIHAPEVPADGKVNWHGVNNPIDWAHTLRAIYQVRCNLFHGGKRFRESNDRWFVGRALRILWAMWRDEIPSHALWDELSAHRPQPIRLFVGRALRILRAVWRGEIPAHVLWDELSARSPQPVQRDRASRRETPQAEPSISTEES